MVVSIRDTILGAQSSSCPYADPAQDCTEWQITSLSSGAL